GEILAELDQWQVVRRWDLAASPPRGEKLPHEGLVSAIALSRDGRRAATGGLDGAIPVWDMATGQAGGNPTARGRQVSALALAPAGPLLLAGSGPATAQATEAVLFDAASSARLATAEHRAPVQTATFAADGRWALTGDLDGVAWLWDVP